ncbi:MULTISPECIES: plasmid segregation protein ParM domain-containing protein [Serratia]|uniref:plasmid segregation protein ParM domain-containing protein n=1 Tax=Serratia TaxID=613 RepID=UPI001C459C4C|nr:MULTISPECIES: plasmid segregation protein ParM domain-containing protein [Serratia]QXN65270.1 StbA family protein [Serratia fonticola]UAN65819.1 StbA family protein [Serratia sp. JSRIV006]
MKLFCDDGSTNVKLAWFEAGTLKTSVSVNSFRNGWKVDGLGSRKTYNYSLDGHKYTYDPVSEAAISTTHIEYQYTDSNVLAVHHALLNSGLEPQEISLTVTLPISEYYTADCQKNELNIERKIKNLLRPVSLNKGEAFTITSVDVMPESLPAVFTRLVSDNVGEFEKSLVIDLGGTTLDVGVIVGQFDDVSAVHGNSKIGVCQVTNATLTALRMASSDTSPMIADELIKKRHDATFFSQVVNDESKQSLVRDTIETAIHKLGEHVVDDLTKFRNVNRVYIVGGGATLIAPAVSKFWAHLGDKVVLMDEPQTALVKAIARFKGE